MYGVQDAKHPVQDSVHTNMWCSAGFSTYKCVVQCRNQCMQMCGAVQDSVHTNVWCSAGFSTYKCVVQCRIQCIKMCGAVQDSVHTNVWCSACSIDAVQD